MFLRIYILEICQQGKKISKSEPRKIIGSTEIEVHSVADDGLNEIQDLLKNIGLVTY